MARTRQGRSSFGRRLLASLAIISLVLLGLPVLTAVGVAVDVVTAAPAQAATPGCSFAAGGGVGQYRDRICWINLADYTNSDNTTGQTITQTLPGGYSLTMRLRRSNSSSNGNASPYAAPTWTGAAIGNNAYLGIQGKPVMYLDTNSSGTDTYVASNLLLKKPDGTTLSNWGVIGADGESTNQQEELIWDVTGTTIKQLESIAGTPPADPACGGGLSSTTTQIRCVGSGTSRVGALIVQAPWVNGMTFSTQVKHPNASNQGFMLGIYLPTITFQKVATGLVKSSDSFTISSTPEGSTTPVTATTAPYTGGTWSGLASTGSTMGFLGGAVTLGEAAASGTSTDLTKYTQSWQCTNANTGSATVLPANGSSGLSQKITPTSGDDNITCVLTNTPPAAGLSVVKTASPTSYAAAGTVISYSFLVTNTGGQHLTGLSVTDTKTGLSAISCPATSLAPGASTTCTATYTTTATDVTNGQVANQATAKATGPTGATVTSAPSSATVPYVASADLVARKVLLTAAPLVAGQQVSWRLEVTNNGPSVAVNPTIADTLPAAVVSPTTSAASAGWTCSITNQNVNCNAASLAVGATASVVVTGTLSPAHTGDLVNTATVSSSTTDPSTANNSATTTTATTARADVGITKSVADPNPVTAGSPLAWQLTVTNAGPSNAAAATVTDTVPSTVTGVTAVTASPGWTCSVSGQVVTCTNPSMAPGATATINVKGTAASGLSGSLTNAASVSTTSTDPVSTNNTSSSTTPVVTSADLLSVKTIATASPAVPGQTVSWRVRVTNNGPSNATSPSLTDTVPTAVTGITWTAPTGWSCALSGQTVTCSASSLTSGQSADIIISGTLSPSFTGNLVNTASVTSTTTDPNTANNSSTATTPTAPTGDLVLTKTRRSGGIPGQPIAWDVVVTNNGPSTATGVSVNDAVPAAVTGVTATGPTGWTCTVSQQNVSCAAASLAPGASASLVIGGTLDPFTTASVVNTATASSAISDPVPGNNSDTNTIAVTPTADVSVVKAKTTPGDAVAGQSVSWTLTVTNAGPSGATGLTVTDAVPSQLTGVTATVAATGWSCTVTGTSVSCPGASLAAGASVVITVTAQVPAGATGSITNSATVTLPASITDSVPGNNTSSVTTPITSKADLAVSKSRSTPNPAVPGQSVSWTVVVTNLGPSDAVSPALADTVTSTVTGVTATTTAPGWTCTVGAGNAVACGASTLAAGASATITIAGTLAPTATGTLANTATVQASNDDAAALANNSATSSTPIAPDADLSVSKSLASPNPAVPGQAVSWTITLTNQGPSTAVNPRLTDPVPTSVTTPTATLSAAATAAGWTCSFTGATLTCQAASMAPGATATVTVSGTLAAATTGNLVNTASASSSTPDSDATDNSSTTTTPTAPSADVRVSKTLVTAAPLVPGTAVAWDLTVENLGPSTATTVALSDTVPSAVTGLSLGASPAGWSCSLSGQAVGCTTATLAPGATMTVRVSGTLAASFTGDLTNSATVSSATPDPATANNTASRTTATSPQADLSLTKSGPTPNPIVPGQSVTWTLTATNGGPSTATAVHVADRVPDGVTGVTATTTASGWTCAVTGQDVGCDAASLAPGASATITVRGTVGATVTGQITNAATVSSAVTDPVPGNNTDSRTSNTAPSADLATTKTLTSASPAVPGQSVTWSVTLTNNGPSTAVNPALTENLPATLLNPSVTTTATGWTCSVNTTTATCTDGSLAPGASVTITVTGTLAAGHTGTLTNSVSASSATPDPATGNNSATSTVPTSASADLAMTKTLTSAAIPGTDVTWELTLTNNGPSTAVSPRIADTVPATVTAVTATPDAAAAAAGWTCTVTGGSVSCGDDLLAPNTTVRVTVTGRLASTATGTLTNSATASTTTSDPTPGNNTGTDSDPITPRADLLVTKSASPTTFVAGSEVTYTILVTNQGPSQAVGLTGRDVVPDGITITSVTTSSSALTCTTTGQQVDCTALGLPAGAGGQVTITGILASSFTGDIVNTVTAGSSTPDPDTTNNAFTLSTPTTASADLVITKSAATPTPAVPGKPVSWVVTVTNPGPSDATGVTMHDAVPAAITAPTVTGPAGWNCQAAAGDPRDWSCTTPVLTSGASASFTVSGAVGPSVTSSIVNTATVASTTSDPVATNNAATTTTPVSPAADLGVVKKIVGTAVPGQRVIWTVDLNHAGPSTAVDARVVDVLPSTVTALQVDAAAAPGFTCAISGQTVTCTAPTLAPGYAGRLTLSGLLAATATGDLANTASITSSTADPATTDNSSTATAPTVATADIRIDKELLGALVPGTTVTYKIYVVNDGPSQAAAKWTRDIFPAGITPITASTDSGIGTCTITGQQVDCSAPYLPVGKLVTHTITATVAPDARGTFTNNASAGSASLDPDPADNTDAVQAVATPQVDLVVDKSVPTPSPLVPGQPATWTITLQNHGPSTATGVSLTDTLPAGVTGTVTTTAPGWQCTGTTCTGDTLAVGAAVTVTVSADVASTVTGTLTNSVTATSVEPELDPSDNTDAVTTATAPSADLAVTKSAPTPAAPVPGQSVSWTVTVTNTGPSTAADVVLTENLPAALDPASIAITPPDGWTCSGQNPRRCAAGSLAPSASATFTVSGTVLPGVTGTITNAASIAASTADPATGNNAASVSATTAPQADLALTKTTDPATPFIPGQRVRWVLTLTNQGPSTAVNPSIADAVPSVLSALTASVTGTGWSCAITGQQLGCSAPSMAPGGVAVVTVEGLLDPSATAAVTNTATATSATPDSGPGANTATNTVTPQPSADLSAVKQYTGAAPVAGDPVQWTVTLDNAGPSTAATPTFTDTIPQGVTGITATAGASGWTCAVTGRLVECTGPDLSPSDPPVVVTLGGSLAADFTGDLVNTGTVTSATADPTPGNDSSTATVTPGVEADLVLTKEHVSGVTPGEPVTWRLTLRNDGPSAAPNPRLRDTLPTTIGSPSATPDPTAAAAGWTCTTTGQVIGCAGTELGAGDTITVTVTGTLAAAATGDIVNTATASSDASDPTPNTATTSFTAVPSADMGIVKSNGSTQPAVPGTRLSYVLEARNAGPSVAQSVVVTDVLPDVLSDIQVSAGSAAWTCGVSGQTVTCTASTLVVGADDTITVSALLATDRLEPFTNTAAVSSATPHPNTANNSSTVTTQVAPSADLAVTKSRATPDPAVAGQPVSWQVRVVNDGPSVATTVRLSDLLPADVTLTGIDAPGWTCDTTTDPAVPVCTLPTLAVGDELTLTVRGTLAAGHTGALVNGARVSSDMPDEHPDDDTASSSTPTTASADLYALKTRVSPAAGEPVVAGETVRWSITVGNDGPSDAVSPTVVDQLPSGITTATVTPPTGWTCTVGERITCTGPGVFASGATATFEVEVTLPTTRTADVVNSATISSPTTDADPDDNTSTVTDPVLLEADITLAKALVTPADQIIAGQRVRWAVTATNSGPSLATGVTLTDTVPVGVSEITWDAGAEWACTLSGQVLTCDGAAQPVAAARTVYVEGLIDASYTSAQGTTDLINLASAIADNDPEGTSAGASTTSTVIDQINLQTTKSQATPNPAIPGQPVSWQITLLNVGPSTAYDVRLWDSLPAGVTGGVLSTTALGWDCATVALECSAPSLLPNAAVTFTVTGDLAPDATGTLVNTAEATSRIGPGSDGDQVGTSSTPISPDADLHITKQLVTDPPVPGTRVAWLVTMTNDGPSSALAPMIEDTITGTLSAVTATVQPAPATTAPGFTCTVNSLQVECTAASMAPGTTVQVRIEADLAPQVTGVLRNDVEVSSDTADSDPSDNTASTANTKVPEVDLWLEKTLLTPEPLVAGQPVTWQVVVHNDGPSTAVNPVVTDVVPAGLVPSTARATSLTMSCSGTTTKSCTTASMAPGTQQVIQVSGTLDPALPEGTAMTNTASVTSDTLELDTGDNTVTTAPSSTVSRTDLVVTKTLAPGQPSPLVAGTPVSWQVSVVNTGPSTALEVELADAVDPAVTGVSVTQEPAGSWDSCTAAGQDVACSIAALAPGATRTFTVSGDLDPSYAATTLTNTAVATTATTDTDPASNNGALTTPVSAPVQLTVEKVADRATVVAGATMTWTVTLTNAGPATAFDPVLVDSFSEKVSVAADGATVTSPNAAGWTCTVFSADLYLQCEGGELTPGESVVLDVVGAIAPDATDFVQNAAFAAATDPQGNPTDEALDEVQTPVTTAADLGVTKTAETASFTPGTAVSWLVTVSNSGPSLATSPTVIDELPSGVTFVSTEIVAGSADAACAHAGGTVTCTQPTLAVGDELVVRIVGTLSAAATGSITNAARLSDTPSDPDPDTTDNAVALSTVLNPSADVSLAKAAVGTFVPGQPVSWTLTVSNAGPSVARDLVVTDTVPDAAGAVTATVSAAGWSCTVTGSTVTCQGTELAPTAAPVTITVTGAELDPSFTGLLGNAAAVTSDTTPDPDGSGNTPSIDTPTAPLASLSVNKALAGAAVPGDQVSWTVTVTNSGPSTATGVTVLDTVVDAVSSVSASGPGWDCSATAGQQVDCAGPDLLPGISSTVTITGLLAADAVGSLANTASAATVTPGDDPADNTAGSLDPLTPRAELSVTKIADRPAPFVPGQQVGWYVEVTNAGPSVADGVHLEDQVDPAVTGLAVSVDQAGWVCTTENQTVLCDAETMPVGTVRVHVTGTLAADYTASTLANAAEVTSRTPQDDTTDDVAGLSTAVEPLAAVSLTKSDTVPGPAVPGRSWSWTLTVTNAGPSVARDLVVTDAVPAALTGVSANTAAPGWSCTLNGSDVSCTGASLAVGTPVTVTVTGTIDPAWTGPLDNAATVTTSTPELDTDDNTDAVSTPTAPAADLRLFKTADAASFVAGAPVSWTIRVVNLGPSVARAPSWTDLLPAGVTLTAVTPGEAALAAGWTCTTTPDVGCSAVSMPVDSTGVTFTVTGTLAASYTDGTIANTATVGSATTPDPVPDNNASVSTTPVTASADLEVDKSGVSPNPAVAGARATWTVTLTNRGPSDAVNPQIVDTLPDDLADASGVADTTGWSCLAQGGELVCGADLLPAGATVVVTVSGILASEHEGSLSNSVTVSSSTPDPSSANNTASVTDDAVVLSDLLAVKSQAVPDPAIPGAAVEWTVEITNNGDSLARGIVVTDSVPAVVTEVSGATTAPGWVCGTEGQLVTCRGLQLAVGASVRIRVTGILDAAFTGQLVNTAQVSAATTDPVADNNRSTSTTDTLPTGQVYLSKSQAIPNPAVAGAAIAWDLTVVNDGPSYATGVQVTDTVDARVTDLDTLLVPLGWGCTVAAQQLTCTAASMAPGTTAVIRLGGTLASSATGTIVNGADLTSASVDPDDTRNHPVSETPITLSSDLAVAKTLTSANPVVPGSTVTWQITALNHGPSDAMEVLLQDDITPAVLDPVVTFDSAAHPDWSCTIVDHLLRCTATRFAPNQPVILTLSGTLDEAFTGSLVNSVNISDQTHESGDPTDNTSTSTVPSAPSADLVIRKTASPDPAIAGDTLTWQVSVTNDGPSTSRQPRVFDTPPVRDVLITGVRTDDPDWSCETADDGGIMCVGDTMTAGETRVITVTGTVRPQITAPVTNVAQVVSGTPDPDNTDNTTSITTPVRQVTEQSVTKALVSANPPVPGETVQWVITVPNQGPSTARGASVTDTIPAGVTQVTATTTAPFGECTVGATAVDCTIPQQDPGSTVTITVTGVLDPSFTGDLTNAAHLTSDVNDPTLDDNDASVTATPVPSADLSLVKSAPTPATPVAGGPVSWTLTVRNSGPSDAANLQVVDTLPAGVLSAVGSGSGWSCSTADVAPGSTVTCDLAALAAGATATVTVSGTLDPDFQGSLTNTATVTSPTPDPDAADRTDSVTSGTTASGVLTVTKTPSATTALGVGDTLTWTITVANAGPSTVRGIALVDMLRNPGTVAPTVDCPQTDLGPGATMTCTTSEYTVVQADVDAGGVVNSVTASGDLPGGTPTTGAGSGATTIERKPSVKFVRDAELIDTADPGYASTNDTVLFTYTVTNTGNTTLRDIEIIDPVAGLVICPKTTLAPGETMTCKAARPHRLTDAEIKAGQVDSTATLHANSGAGACDGCSFDLQDDVRLSLPLPPPLQDQQTGTATGTRPPPLAHTGSEALTLTTMGLGWLVAGALFLLIARRRRDAGTH